MRNRIFDILKSNKNMIFFFGCSILFRLFIRIIIIDFINPMDIHDPLVGFLYYTSEPYQDYKIYYQNYAHSFLFTDWLPYVNIEFVKV